MPDRRRSRLHLHLDRPGERAGGVGQSNAEVDAVVVDVVLVDDHTGGGGEHADVVRTELAPVVVRVEHSRLSTAVVP